MEIKQFLNKIFSQEDDSDVADDNEENEEKPKKKRRTHPLAWAVIIIFIIVIGVAYLASQSPTATVYLVQCNDWFLPTAPYTFTPPAVQDFSNCHQPKAMNRQVFTADVSKNQVIETSPDTADVIQLNSCTIQDNQHWSCGTINSMSGGMLAATVTSRSGDNFAEHGLPGVIFVTETQWSSVNNGKSSECGLKWCN